MLALSGCAPVLRARDLPPVYAPAKISTPHRLAYRVIGPPASCATRAAPIVFVPALGFSGHEWEATAAQLSACRARVLVDLPGLGESEPLQGVHADEALRALGDVLDAESPDAPVILAGSSVGGVLAARFAALRPERVAAVVLVDAPATPYAGPAWVHQVTHPAPWAPLFRLVGPSLAIRSALKHFALAKPDDPTVAMLAYQLTDVRRRATMLSYYDVFLDDRALVETRAQLAHVRAPVLILQGDRDRVVPPEVADAIAQALPPEAHATVEHLPELGHLGPLQAPQLIAQRIDAFVATLPSAPAAPPAASARQPAVRAVPAGKVLYGNLDEWFPLLGVSGMFSTDSRIDLGFTAGVARGSIDRHYPLEAGRLVWTAGVAVNSDPINLRSWSFSYIRTTVRLELVWRWAGGFHIDGTLTVDPQPNRVERVGGWGALGYTPSVLPWLRGFVGYGSFPISGGRVLFGFEIDAPLTRKMY